MNDRERSAKQLDEPWDDPARTGARSLGKDEPLREEDVTRADRLDDRVEEGQELPEDDTA